MNNNQGSVFLEIVITVGVLAVLIGAIANLIVTSYNLLGYSRTRITARHLANEKIELIRNLPFDLVAVAGGVPAGNLPQLETLSRNGLDYVVRTNVVYVDDEYDGLAPDDSLPIDYKRARVDVSWTGTFESDSTVTLITDIAPPGVETTGAGGTISILVFDSLGAPVEEAEVHLTNTEIIPNVDLRVKTNSFGRVMLPGAPVCNECYGIEVTREGYSTDRTYTTEQVANPFQPLVSVMDSQVTEVSFAIDRLSTINFKSVRSRENNYALLANQFFNFRGSKVIGTNTQGGSVYKYDQLLQTDGNGVLTKTDVEWDNYLLTLPASNWDLGGSNPMSPFGVAAGETMEAAFVSVASQNQTLLLKITDASGSAIPSAFVTIEDETILSGDTGMADMGQSFFSLLLQKTYMIEATKSGYLNTSLELDVSGDMEETIIMNQEL